jgi:hypothetical protein
MKMFRAIEFGKLIWLITDDTALIWHSANMMYEEGQSQNFSNWWLSPAFTKTRRFIVSDICKNSESGFFENSFYYNAMQGGRFNPAKSFGVLYSSSNPLLSALEVLYHQYCSAYPLYRRMNKSSSQFTSSFNVQIPKKLDLLIVSFEIEVDEKYCNLEVCDSSESLEELCRSIGFERYIGDNFSRDFIFGNDYEISRLIGSHLHTKDTSSFKVPSARIDFKMQDEDKIRNFIIPEKEFDSKKIKLTGKFYEFRTQVDLELIEGKYHSVDINTSGETELNSKFYLQPKPSKKNKNQYLKYEPNSNHTADKKKYFREVELQKFYSKKDIEKTKLEEIGTEDTDL